MYTTIYNKTEKIIQTNLFNHNCISPIFLRPLQFSYQDLHRAIFSDLHLKQTVFIHSNLRGAFLFQTHFKNCHFIGCNMIVISASNCTFENCLFQHCRLRHATFNHCIFKDCRFENCDMEGVEGAPLTH